MLAMMGSQATNARNGLVQSIENMIKCSKDSKNQEQMLLATKDEAEVHLDEEENDFMLDNAYGDHTLEELNAAVEHDTNAHDRSLHDFETLINNVQVEAEKQRKMNVELKKQKTLVQRELETCKEQVKEFENNPEEVLDYKEAYKELKNEMNVEKEQLLNEKEEILYDPHLKTGMGYENLERLNKAIKAQPKRYGGEKLESTKLKVDLPDYKETLEDAEKSRLKMKDKMIPPDYAELNALYESFVPQTEIPVEQTYFSSPSTSNVSS
nr:hypothetical protein [Tanacetum cinerariifolium]